MRMLKNIRRKWLKELVKSTSGIALTEVTVAVIVLALILAVVPPVLALVLHSQYSWTEQRVAESLTRNQIEYIKSAAYISGNDTYPELPGYTRVPKPDDTYTIDITAKPIHPVTKDYLSDIRNDQGVQEITIQIYHGDVMVLRTVNYKIDRLGIRAV
ncbi:MAG: hypothetical protein JSW38_11080 [Dehalococcoidia bacterium]|nr:MAG: hypothetical protein JSW38_11080 [Dehalococcoidia bacterium]